MATKILVDGFGRRIDYLRVSVTDRCDLRCQYCLPEDYKDFEEPANWLTHAEMARLIGLFAELGVSKIRLTGGEPLTRRGVCDLAAKVAEHPNIHDLSMSTNGTRLSRHAIDLKRAGVQRLNVSLDTLDPASFQRITGRDCLQQVIDGLEAASDAGFEPIKINCVVHHQTLETDVEQVFEYCFSKGFILRLIEAMPLGRSGQQYQYVDVNSIASRLAGRFGLIRSTRNQGPGPARYWIGAENFPAVGVITPMSQHFCELCNRVRLSVDGTLYLCLGQEATVPLGTALRNGANDGEIQHLITEGIAAKPERHEFTTSPTRITRVMAKTGG